MMKKTIKSILLLVIFISLSTVFAEENHFSFNSHLQQATYDAINQKVYIWDAGANPIMEIAVEPDFVFDENWSQTVQFKIVSGNMSGYTFKAAQDAKANRYVYGLKKAHKKTGEFSHLSQNSISNFVPFELIGNNHQLTNTVNNTIKWQQTSTANESIAFYQVLRHVTENVWEIHVDQIPNHSLQVTLNNTLSGKYGIRKVLTSGQFIDSDGENSQGAIGDIRLAKSFELDIIPPLFIQPFTVVKTKDNRNNSIYNFSFTVSEESHIYFSIYDAQGQLYYDFQKTIPEGDYAFTWDGISNQQTYSDNDYGYAFYMEDLATNISDTITGNARIDFLPPTITLLGDTGKRRFSPNDDGRFDVLEYEFTFSEKVMVDTALCSSANQKIWEQTTTNLVTRNIVQLNSNQFSSIPDGEYTLKITATDKDDRSITLNVDLIVDRTPPVTNAPPDLVFSSPNPAYQYAYQGNEFGYLEIQYASKIVTRNMFSYTETISLNGADVTDGIYEGLITVSDFLGNEAQQHFQVTVDHTAPEITQLNSPDTIDLNKESFFSYQAEEAISSEIFMDIYVTSQDTAPHLLYENVTPNTYVDLGACINTIPNFNDHYYQLEFTIRDGFNNKSVSRQDVIIAKNAVEIVVPHYRPVSFLDNHPKTFDFELYNGPIHTVNQITIELRNDQNQILAVLKETDDADIENQSFSFDGKIENQFLTDGVYTLFFKVISAVGIESDCQASIDVDHTAPEIQNLSILNSPNNHTQNFYLNLTGYDRTNAFGGVALLYDNQPVLTISEMPSNTIGFSYDGRINGSELSEGTHSFIVVLSDSAGNQSSQVINLEIDLTPPQIDGSVSLSKSLIKPDGDQIDDEVTIQFNTTEAATLQLEIDDANGNLFKTRFDDSELKTNFSLIWDGHSDDFRVMDDTYTIQLHLTDQAGNTAQIHGGEIVVHTVPAAISRCDLSSLKVKPGSPISIDYVVPGQGIIMAKIVDTRDQLIKLLADTTISGGQNQLIWDGTNSAGFSVEDQDYYLEMSFTDEYGFSSEQPLRKKLQVDGTAPNIHHFTLSSDLVPLNRDWPFKIDFGVYETVDAEIKLLNEHGQLVGSISSFQTSARTNRISDALQNLETALNPSRYVVQLKIQDEAGNFTVQEQNFQVILSKDVEINAPEKIVFSPDNDQYVDHMICPLTLSASGTKHVTANIHAFNGRLIKTLYSGEVVTDYLSLQWSGQDENGQVFPDAQYTLKIELTDPFQEQAVREIPVYLITERIKISYQDNGPYFSFNQDNVKDELHYTVTLTYPDLMLDDYTYSAKSNLKLIVMQTNRVIKEEILLGINDHYVGSFKGEGLTEGDFEIRITGEDQDQIPVEPVVVAYMNDVTVPEKPIIKGIFSSNSIHSLTSGTVQTLFNTDQIDLVIESTGSHILEFYSDQNTLLQAVTGNRTFSVNNIQCQEGENRFYFQVYDLCGNTLEEEGVTVQIDLTYPVIVTENISNLQYLKAGEYEIDIEFSEAIQSSNQAPQVFLVSGPNRIPVNQGKVIVAEDAINGSYQLLVESLSDLAGNVINVTGTQNYIIDTQNPEKPYLRDFHSIINQSLLSDLLYVEATNTVQIVMDDTLVKTFVATTNAVPLNIDINEGTHHIQIHSIDRAGNESEVLSYELEVDLGFVRLVSESITDLTHLKAGTYPFTLTFSENLSTAEYLGIQFKTAQHVISPSGVQLNDDTITGEILIEQGTFNASDYHFEIIASDLAQNQSHIISTVPYTVDTQKPRTPLWHQDLPLLNTTQYDNSVMAESGTFITVKLDGNSVAEFNQLSNQESVSFVVSEGDHILSLVSIDPAGNISDESTKNIRIDITPIRLDTISFYNDTPVSANTYEIQLTFSETVLESQQPSLKIRTANGLYRDVTIATYSQTTCTGTVTFLDNDDGQAILEVDHIYDLAENKITAHDKAVFLVDTTPPTPPRFVEEKTLINTASYTNQLITDPNSIIHVYVDSVLAKTYPHLSNTADIQFDLTEGIHQIKIIAVDAVGNISESLDTQIKVDLTLPELISETIEDLQYLKAGFYQVELVFSEPISTRDLTIQFKTDSQTINPEHIAVSDCDLTAQISINPSTFNADNYHFDITIRDLAQNQAHLISDHYYVIDTQSPAIPTLTEDITLSNTTLYKNQVEAEIGTTVVVNVDNVLETSFVQQAVTENIQFFLSEGTHTISITAQDIAGNISDSLNQTIEVDNTVLQVAGIDFYNATPVSANTYEITVTLTEPVSKSPLFELKVRTADGEYRNLVIQAFNQRDRSFTSLVTFLPGDDGQSVLEIDNIHDLAGNKITPIEVNIFMVDTIAPSKPALVSGKTLINSLSYTDQLIAEDNAVIEIYVDNQFHKTYQHRTAAPNIQFDLTEGLHQIRIRSIDAAGNCSESFDTQIEVDIQAPSLISETIADLTCLKAGTYDLELVFSEPISPDHPTIKLKTDTSSITATNVAVNQAKITAQVIIPSTLHNADNYHFELTIKDLAQNEITIISTTHYVVDTQSPQAPIFSQNLLLTNSSVYENNIIAEKDSVVTVKLDGIEVRQFQQVNLQEPVSFNISEGTHTFALSCVDLAGNQSEPHFQDVSVDITSIELDTISFYTATPVSANTYEVHLTFTEPVLESQPPQLKIRTADLEYRDLVITSYSNAHCIGEVTFQVGDDGQAVLELDNVYDRAGNKITAQDLDIFMVDTTPPDPPHFLQDLTLVNNLSYSNQIQAEITATVEIFLNNALNQTYIQNQASELRVIDLPNEGIHQIFIRATDIAGNRSSLYQIIVRADLTMPQLLSDSIEGKTYFKAGTYTVTAEFSEALDSNSNLEIVLKSATEEIFASAIIISNTHVNGTFTIDTGSNGGYELEFRQVTDLAQNATTVLSSNSYILDTQIPILTFDSFTSNIINQTQYLDKVVASEDYLLISLFVDGNHISNTQLSQNRNLPIYLILAEGQHTISLSAIDLAGNISETLTKIQEIDLTKPELVQFQMLSPSPVKAGTYTVSLQFNEAMQPTHTLLEFTVPSGVKRIATNSHYDETTHTYSADVSFLAGDDGQSHITISGITDLAGNSLDPITLSAFFVDTVAPVINTVNFIHDLVQPDKTRKVNLQVYFSEPVSVNYYLDFPQSNTRLTGLNLYNDVQFIVPPGINEAGTFILANIQDAAGNTIPDDATRVYFIDSLVPEISLQSFSTTTNRGTLSDITIIADITEPIQTHLLTFKLYYPDRSYETPQSVVYNAERTQCELHFNIKPTESDLTLEAANLVDDKNNSVLQTNLLLADVDNVAPVIDSFGANVSVFSAIRNVGEADVAITLNITEDYTQLVVRIYDKNMRLVKTLWDRNGSAGFIELDHWNGVDNSSLYLPKGWYMMQAYAIDDHDNQSLLAKGLFEITEDHLDLISESEQTIPYSCKVSGPISFRYTFNERTDNPDLLDKPTGIRMMAFHPVGKITETIYKKETSGLDTLIATLKTNQAYEPFQGQNSLAFNGHYDNDVNNAFVPSGEYYLKVTAHNMKELFESEITFPFVIDHDNPIAFILSKTQHPISFRINSLNEFVVTFNINDNITPNDLDIKLSFPELDLHDEKTDQANGQAVLKLNIQDDQTPLTDGVYTLNLTITDKAGNTTMIHPTVTLDSTLPVFTYALNDRLGFVSQNIQVTITSLTEASPCTILYKLGSGTYQTQSFFDVSHITEQTETIYVRIQDAAHNTTEIPTTVSIDNAIQLTSFNAKGNEYTSGYTNTTALTLTDFTYAENHPYYIYFKTNNGAWQQYANRSAVSWTLPSAEGTYTIYMKLEDKAGNVSGIVSDTITLDTTAPVINSIDLSQSQYNRFLNNTYYYDSFDLKLSNWTPIYTETNKKSTAYINTIINNNTPLHEGQNTVGLQVVDLAGNWSSIVAKTVMIDTTNPVITHVSNPAHSAWVRHDTDQKITVNYIEANCEKIICEIKLNNVHKLTKSYATNQININDLMTSAVADFDSGIGSNIYTCVITVKDLVGRTQHHESSIKIDVAPPTITESISGYIFGPNQKAATLTLTCDDENRSGVNTASYQYKVGNAAWSPFSSGQSIDFCSAYSEGNYDVQIKAKDNLSNEKIITLTSPIRVDKTNPNISSLVCPTYMNIANSTIRTTITATDTQTTVANLTYEYKINTSAYQPASNHYFDIEDITAGVTEGANTVDVRVHDEANNFSELSYSFTKDTVAPTITASHTSGSIIDMETEVITFTASDASPATGVEKIYYLLDYNGTPASAVGNTIAFSSLSFMSGGAKDFWVWAVDKACNGTKPGINEKYTYTLDMSSPTITINSTASEMQAKLDPNSLEAGTVLTTYTISDTDTNIIEHQIKIFKDNQTYVNIDCLQHTSPYQLKWDGWVSTGNNHYQLPEGNYTFEISIKDQANKVTTYNHQFMLNDDLILYLSGLFTPQEISCEFTGNELEVKYASGPKISTVIDSTVTTASESDKKIPFIIDVPQTAIWHENDNNEENVRSRIYQIRYYGDDSTRTNLVYTIEESIKQGNWLDHDPIYLSAGYYDLYTSVDADGNWYAARRGTNLTYTVHSQYNTWKPETNQEIQHSTVIPLFNTQYKSPVYHFFSRKYAYNDFAYKVNVDFGTVFNLSVIEDPRDANVNYMSWLQASIPVPPYFLSIRCQRYYPNNQYTAQLQTIMSANAPQNAIVLSTPKTTEDEITVVRTSCPTFKWEIPTSNLTAHTSFRIELFKGPVSEQSGLVTFNFVEQSTNDDYQLIEVPAGTYQQTGRVITFTPDVYNSLGQTNFGEVYRWQVLADWNGDRTFDQYSTTSEVFELDPPLAIEAPINYPNPFKDTTKIRYKLTQDAQKVYIKIFDLVGKPVRTITDAPVQGTRPYHEYNEILWDGKNGAGDSVNNGVYIYKIIATDENGKNAVITGKMVKLR